MKIVVLGAGSYGISLAYMLAKKKENEIVICSHSEETVNDFNKNHYFEQFPNKKVPNNITLTASYEEALNNAKLIFLVPSVKYIRNICNKIKGYYHNIPICIASKGIENESLSYTTNIVKEILHTKNIAIISGPTFAIDLINNEPAALAIGGLNKNTIKIVKENLENDTLKLRISSDIIGIQLCGSVKNIVAIAAGIIKGLGYSESTTAFLINESLHDMKNIIHALGGKRKTILSFAGIGDLLLTCSSTKSRNYSFGYVIGSTKDQEKIQEYLNNNTVEGYYTLKSIYKMLNKKGIEIPLITLIYNIIYNNEDPGSLITFLITKD
jgi:glycerol-3-phosphate dehydrogenase (NAD(P)+)